MIEWHYEMTEGAWGNRSGTALSMKAAKRSMRADLRSRYPGSKLPRLVKQPSLPDTQLYDLEGEDYEGFASFTTLDPEGMAEFTAGWGEEPSPYPLANPLALDNWGQAIGRSVMLLARSPAVKRMAVFVGRELGREALTHLLNMSKEERGAWLYKNLRRIPYLSSQLDRLSPEQKVAVTQAVAGALENKQVQRAIDKQLAHKVSANPRARNNFFGPFKAEKTAPRMTYVEGMERAQDMAADAKQRLALRHGWKGYFLVKMPKVRGSGHVWFYLSSVTLREMGRASVYGAPQTKITASNPWATVLRNLDAIRDPSGYQIVELDTLTGKVTGPLSYSSVEAKAGIKGNPKKRKRKATSKAKRRNVHHEDALSRKTTRGHKRKERKRSVAKGHSRKPKHKGQAKLNPVQDLKVQVDAFAERLRSWNLKYYDLPDISAWLDENWTASYGREAARDYLVGLANRRSESYWGQSTRSRRDIADEAERSRRLRAVYSDLAGDEVRQNPRLTRRPQAPYVWEESIYKDGKLVETVYYDDIQAFFWDIEQANPGGNQQVYDNWKEGRARHSTHYVDGADVRWDLYFRKMRDPRARMNPKSAHFGRSGRYYEPQTDQEAQEYLSRLTDLLPQDRFEALVAELRGVKGGMARWAHTKAYLIGAGEDRYTQKVYDSIKLYDLRENPRAKNTGGWKTYQVVYKVRYYGRRPELEKTKVRAASPAEAEEKLREDLGSKLMEIRSVTLVRKNP